MAAALFELLQGELLLLLTMLYFSPHGHLVTIHIVRSTSSENRDFGRRM